jgi:RNA polymerase sigma factor (sigma-70 family)
MGDLMTVEALRRRRPEALEDLLAAYGREIHAAAYMITRDRQDAEDVVIETLLTAYEKAGSIRDDAALRAWLYRVATNHALGMRRRSGRIVRLQVVPDRIAPGDVGRETTDRTVLLDGVAALPPRTRAALVLRYYADLSVRDVAAALGTSENTVKTQLRDALAALRRTLGEAPAGALEANHA